jgi:hypothetical protein
LALLVAALWLILKKSPASARSLAYFASLVLLGELLGNSYGVQAQSDTSLYYPEVPVFSQLKKLPDGRVCGLQCFPPMLNQFYGLQDIRGYDGVDPRWVVELLLDSEQDSPLRQANPLPHAATMFHVALPESPIHDLLGVRYVLFHGQPAWGDPVLQGTSLNDYSIYRRGTATSLFAMNLRALREASNWLPAGPPH